MLKQWKEWREVAIATFSVAGTVLLLQTIGVFQLLELVAFDQFFRWRPLEATDRRIIVVGIDEIDLQRFNWPISDEVLAQAIQRISQQQPRAIGLDIYRDLAVEPGTEDLEQVLRSTPNLIGIRKVVGSGPNTATPAHSVLADLQQVAANDLPIDIDGKIRRSFLYLDDEAGDTVFSLGFKMAQIYLAADGTEPEMLEDEIRIQLGKATFAPLQANDGGYVRTNDAGYQTLLNYRGPGKRFETFSLSDIIDRRVELGKMRDRIVLIGSTAESLKDTFLTPYSNLLGSPDQMAGVEVHANIVSQITSAALEGRLLMRTWPQWGEQTWVLFWSALGAIISWKWRSSRKLAQKSLGVKALQVSLASTLLLGTAYLAFLNGWWIPLVPPLIALTGAAIASTGYILWDNLRLSYRQIEEYARTLEIKVEQRTQELQDKNQQLEQTLEQLKAAQTQIIAQEKLASLGALTAGVAHEISNPLNFVNNFAELSVDLTEEISEVISEQTAHLEGEVTEDLQALLGDLKEGLGEISQHGTRAASIVRNMLKHAGAESSNRFPTDINDLLDEAIQLAYQSLHVNHPEFEADIKTHYDPALEPLNVVPQDINRAFLNLVSNACDAMADKATNGNANFAPTLSVETKDLGDRVRISIRDNGKGIPQEDLDKIFNPFFTTKPAGEGTGLGLSLTHDILVGQHQGSIDVDTIFGEYVEFIIHLPKQTVR